MAGKKSKTSCLTQLAGLALVAGLVAAVLHWSAHPGRAVLWGACGLVAFLALLKFRAMRAAALERKERAAKLLPKLRRALEGAIRACRESKNPRTLRSKAKLGLQKLDEIELLQPGAVDNSAETAAFFRAVSKASELKAAWEKLVAAKTTRTRSKYASVVRDELANRDVTDEDLASARVEVPGMGERLTIARIRADLDGQTEEGAVREKAPALAAARWIPRGEAIRIGEYRIAGGLVYVGSGLAGVADGVETEAALIDPELPVGGAEPDVAGRGMGAWPSYAAIPPACRAAYLEWLAAGREDPSTYVGYVFLYFYGLERRVLHDAARSRSTRDEVESIREEVERLLRVYGGNKSFAGHARGFLDIVDFVVPPAFRSERRRDEPPSAEVLADVPLSLKLGLAERIAEGRPIPADWALAWVSSHPRTRLRTPALRCPDEFRALFEAHYRADHGEGIVVPQGPKRLIHLYRPASPSFAYEPVMVTPNLPDPPEEGGTVEALSRLVERCCDELDPFSRYVGGESSARDDLVAAALLPEILDARELGPGVRRFGEEVESLISKKDRDVIPSASLVDRWPRARSGRLTKADCRLLADLLQRWGVGVEPDVRFGGRPLRTDARAVLFRLPAEARTEPSATYPAATLILQLAAAVVGSDRGPTAEEMELLEQHLRGSLDLGLAERDRLEAHMAWLLTEGPGLTGVRRRLEPLPEERRAELARLLVALACADGVVDPAEVRILSKVYGLLGLDPNRVHSDLHSMSIAHSHPEGEPEPPAAGEPADASPGDVSLDRRVIERKLTETDLVSELLSGIFEEDEEPERAEEPVPEDVDEDATAIGGLDASLSRLVLRMVARPSWSREEFEELASSLGLMPDGALESVNDAAFELCDAPLSEGDDPLVLDPEVAKELTT